MNAAQVLDHFDRIGDAPNAIPRLRRFILDLAVRGKLVEQDPDDEPASELLKLSKRISSKTLFDLPHHWIAAKIGELLDFQYGKALLANERLNQGRVSVFGSNGIVGYGNESLTEDSAIIVGRKGSAGALNLCMGPSWTTDVAYFVIPPPFLDIHFLLIALQTLDLPDLGKGVKPGLSRSDVYELDIAVPPTAEQRRIVAKVDELMALCDRLEAARAERESRRDRLVAASLHRLNNGADADEFREHIGFHLRHLPLLTTRPEHIQQLRQTILNLAVRGKLVPQDPKDEPSSELLKRIQAEKEKLGREGKTSRPKPVSAAEADELGFQLMPGWSAARISQILLELQTGPFGSSLHQSDYQVGGVPVINPASIKNERLFPIDGMAVGTATLMRLATFKLRAGDIVMGRRGEMGRSAIVTEQEDGWLCGTGCLILRLPECLSARFLVKVIGSPLVRKYLGGSAVGITMQNLNQSILLNLAIGVPPLAEQRRIVAKVEELMALCDRLETQLTTTQAESRRLLEAVLHEALNGPSVFRNSF
jgi:type I restriction enzyme S subunit